MKNVRITTSTKTFATTCGENKEDRNFGWKSWRKSNAFHYLMNEEKYSK